MAFEGQAHRGPVALGQIVRRDPELVRANVAKLPVHHFVVDEL